uniref:Uncharacterized protein n=1 Tax=Oryza barthii TaxID=65489 RepID=A0A0D3GZW8_9ORYZ
MLPLSPPASLPEEGRAPPAAGSRRPRFHPPYAALGAWVRCRPRRLGSAVARPLGEEEAGRGRKERRKGRWRLQEMRLS